MQVNGKEQNQVSSKVMLLVQYQRNSIYLLNHFYLPGTGLSLAAGAVFGWTFGQEFANHYLQLYRMDTLAAQSKFMEWWEAKCVERS